MSQRADAVTAHPVFNWFVSFMALFGASGPILLIVQCMKWLKSAKWPDWDLGWALTGLGYQPESISLLGVRKIVDLVSGVPLWVATPTIAILTATGIFTTLDKWDAQGK